MKKLLGILAGLFLVVGLTSGASAITYEGEIQGPDSNLEGTGSWYDATLSWVVDDEKNPGYWTYAYTFTVDAKGISHVIIEASENFTASNIFTGTTPGWELGTFGEGQSNPGIPAPLYGLKWDTPEGEWLEYIWTIVTDRAPMDGNFYAKDGQDNGTWVYAYNITAIPVPDTQTVPEPATMLLLGSGLIGLAGFGRKKLFKK